MYFQKKTRFFFFLKTNVRRKITTSYYLLAFVFRFFYVPFVFYSRLEICEQKKRGKLVRESTKATFSELGLRGPWEFFLHSNYIILCTYFILEKKVVNSSGTTKVTINVFDT